MSSAFLFGNNVGEVQISAPRKHVKNNMCYIYVIVYGGVDLNVYYVYLPN